MHTPLGLQVGDVMQSAAGRPMWRDDTWCVDMCHAADHLINSPAHVYALQLAGHASHQWSDVTRSSDVSK